MQPRAAARDNASLANGGPGFNVFPFYFSAFGSTQLSGNAAVANGSDGFHMASTVDAVANIAVGNLSAGFAMDSGGFGSLVGNVATGNGDPSGNAAVGFVVVKPSSAVGNAALGNLGEGFRVDPFPGRIAEGSSLRRNNAVGNVGHAVETDPALDFPLQFEDNALYGNVGCGLSRPAGQDFPASDNFWGSPAGPASVAPPAGQRGPDDADELCEEGTVDPTAGLPAASKARKSRSPRARKSACPGLF